MTAWHKVIDTLAPKQTDCGYLFVYYSLVTFSQILISLACLYKQSLSPGRDLDIC